jgi:hypothetical protein
MQNYSSGEDSPAKTPLPQNSLKAPQRVSDVLPESQRPSQLSIGELDSSQPAQASRIDMNAGVLDNSLFILAEKSAGRKEGPIIVGASGPAVYLSSAESSGCGNRYSILEGSEDKRNGRPSGDKPANFRGGPGQTTQPITKQWNIEH